MLTGPITLNSVNSNTFSIADFEGSRGGGLTRVERSAIAENGFGGNGRGRVCERGCTVAGSPAARGVCWSRGV